MVSSISVFRWKCCGRYSFHFCLQLVSPTPCSSNSSPWYLVNKGLYEILFLCSFSVTATYSPHFLYVPPSSTLKEYYTIWKRPLFTPINCTIFTKKIKFVTIEYLNNRGSNNLWYYCNVVVHEFRNWFSLNTSKGTGGVADKIIVSNCLQLENNSRGCNINFSEQDLKFRVEL